MVTYNIQNVNDAYVKVLILKQMEPMAGTHCRMATRSLQNTEACQYMHVTWFLDAGGIFTFS
jgi:hypothetical protein